MPNSLIASVETHWPPIPCDSSRQTLYYFGRLFRLQPLCKGYLLGSIEDFACIEGARDQSEFIEGTRVLSKVYKTFCCNKNFLNRGPLKSQYKQNSYGTI